MATTEFIAAIELGSSKITGVHGRKNSDGSMQILAYAQEDSSTFIRKGVIFNLDKTAQSLTSIINRLEGELNNSIAKVYVGIGGQSLRTIRNVESCDVPQEDNGCVTQELIDSLCDANRETPLINFASIPMTILDVAPQEYKIDKNAQLNPVGALGTHIDGNFLNIVVRTSLLTNLELCFKRARITIADWFISPLVLADVVLNENERRSGCALIDFGADTTTLSVYKNNILRFLTVLPLGGKNITRDLTTLQIEEEEAERLKLEYGCALLEDEEEDKEAETCQLEDGRKVTLNEINNIVEARTEEIVANVWNLLRDSGYEDKLLAGLVITGGAANLPQLTNVLQKKTKISKIRMAKSVHSTVYADLSEDILRKDGTQNTLMGLLFAGTENCCLQETPPEENLVAETVAPEKPGHEEEIPEPTPHHPTENSTKPNNKPRKGPDKPKKPGLFDKLGQFSRNLFDDDTSDTF